MAGRGSCLRPSAATRRDARHSNAPGSTHTPRRGRSPGRAPWHNGRRVHQKCAGFPLTLACSSTHYAARLERRLDGRTASRAYTAKRIAAPWSRPTWGVMHGGLVPALGTGFATRLAPPGPELESPSGVDRRHGEGARRRCPGWRNQGCEPRERGRPALHTTGLYGADVLSTSLGERVAARAAGGHAPRDGGPVRPYAGRVLRAVSSLAREAAQPPEGGRGSTYRGGGGGYSPKSFNATAVTAFAWPLYTLTDSPFSKSHSRAVLSEDAAVTG